MKKHFSKTIVLKLGGSIITKKLSSRPRLRKKIIRQLAKELKIFIQRFPEIKIILLHGAGSFGHPLVYRHKLLERPLTGPRLLGFAKTVCSMRHMANLLAETFWNAELPVLPLQASAVLNEKNNAMALFDIHHLKQVVNTGFIPLLGGDMGLTKKNRAVVVSADRLAVVLAEAFSVSKIIFTTDVNGVFDKFPISKDAKPLPSLSRKEIKSMLRKMDGRKTHYDITGSMVGKLRTTLILKNKEVIIFNGLKYGNLTKALTGESVGTRLLL